MKADISKIIVGERVRKDGGDIEAFAKDIQQNGLINPISVMRIDGGELKLLAGFRRMKAAELLGWSEIEVSVLSPADAEAALLVEISENEQRKPFTISEITGYGKLLEEIEHAKAKERMLAGKKNEPVDPVPFGAQGTGGRTRDIVAAKMGIGKTNYDCAKYIAANAPPEIIEQIDRGERTIRGTYDELRAKDKAVETEPESLPQKSAPEPIKKADFSLKTETPPLQPQQTPPSPPPRPRFTKVDPLLAKLQAEQAEATRKRQEFEALTTDEKIAELQRQLKEQRVRANSAESDLAREKELRQNDVYHRDGTIENQKMQISSLRTALEAAEARIKELEEMYEPDKHTD